MATKADGGGWQESTTCALWIVGVSDGKVVPIVKEFLGRAIYSVDWAPKGDRVAMTMNVKVPEGSDKEMGVWLMKADGSDLRRIDSAHGDGESASLPQFSPDGSRLCYRLHRKGSGTDWAAIYDLATGTERQFFTEPTQNLPEFGASAASAAPANSAAPAK